MNTVTQFAERSSTKAYEQDGYTMGYLENFKIDQSGTITGVYSNGANRTLGQIALAGFANQGGLEREEHLHAVQQPGVANVSVSEWRGRSSSPEPGNDNVDLTEQFTDLIVTQRLQFETVQTSDTLLDTVLNLKRH